MLNINY